MREREREKADEGLAVMCLYVRCLAEYKMVDDIPANLIGNCYKIQIIVCSLLCVLFTLLMHTELALKSSGCVKLEHIIHARSLIYRSISPLLALHTESPCIYFCAIDQKQR